MGSLDPLPPLEPASAPEKATQDEVCGGYAHWCNQLCPVCLDAAVHACLCTHWTAYTRVNTQLLIYVCVFCVSLHLFVVWCPSKRACVCLGVWNCEYIYVGVRMCVYPVAPTCASAIWYGVWHVYMFMCCLPFCVRYVSVYMHVCIKVYGVYACIICVCLGMNR